MKKYLIISLLLFIGIGVLQAQKKAPSKPQRVLILNKTDKSQVKYPVSEIDSITFGESAEVVESPATAEMKDLGLSVKWATFNLGATSESEPGYKVGWADNTLKCKSQNSNYYPSILPPSTIINTEYDVANLMWEDKWRMPSDKEFKELVDSCDWQWDEDKQGYQVTSKINGESIFFPVGGYRNGEAVPEDSKLNGYYWTGILSSPNSHAKAVVMQQTEGKDTAIVQPMERYLGLMIRPVYGDYVLPLSVSAELQGVPGYTNASIKVSFDGDADGTTLYGVAYELVPSGTAEFDFNKAKKVSRTGKPTQKQVEFELTGLEEGKAHRAVAYAILGTDTVKSPEMVLFTTDARYVDLGLSVKWAKWNIGAESTNEYGGYYGWGDITGELVSPYANKYAVGNTSTSIAGNPNYDIAVAKWGGRWRMPTKAEFEELINATVSTTWTYDTSGGVKKYIASFSNGQSLEFPYDGYMNSSLSEKVSDSHGYYWTADATDDLLKAYVFHMNGPRARTFPTSEKYIHVFIRPVYDEGQTPVTPEGPQDDTTKEASSAVDMGLYSGNLWATYNVGAKKETESGVYVAWGELQEKISEGYYQNNYAYLDENNTQYGGYSTALGLNIAGTDYDIAHVRWKGDWQMPTDADFKELRDDCTWTAETRSGVFGYKVTGPNGKSIFLPCAGYYNGSEHIGANEEGNYWCSTMYMFAREYQMGYAMNFSQANGYELTRFSRKGGLTVRPVKHKK